jgi:lysophospholipid acyltransferase (LPLAT)-like uncharacterized protein
MKRAVASVLGLLGYVYLRFCFRTSRYVVSDEAEAVLKRTWDRDIPTVFACWHDEFLICLLSLLCPRVAKPLFITNDSFGGIFLEVFCRLVGNPCIVIKRGSPLENRIDRLANGLAEHRRLAIAADYGRPWYKARPTADQLAARTDGYVVGMRLEPRRKWKIPLGFAGGVAFLPTPFTSYTLWLSEPHRAGDADLGEKLNALSRRSSDQPARSPVVAVSPVAETQTLRTRPSHQRLSTSPG